MVAGRLQEKNGFYYIVLSYTDSAGKRRQPWIGTGLPVKGNKKRAEKMLAETRKSFTIPKGQVSELSPDMAFSDYMRYWLKMMRTAVTETKIKPIRGTVNKALAYILDPAKTDDQLYQKAKDKTAFRAKHEAELVIFEAAKSTLLAVQGDRKLPRMKALQAEQERLTEEQQRLYDKRAKLKKEAKQIDTIKANVDSYLRPIASQEQKTKRRSELE